MDIDSQSIGMMIVVLMLLVAASAFFSATETAFSSVNKIRMKSKAEDGDKKAAAALKLSEDYDRLLSGVLIGNNIVNIAASTLATVLFTTYSVKYGATISTVFMTVVILIFAEVTPKTLAKQRPEAFAMAATPFVSVLLVVITPLNALFGLWRKLLELLIDDTDQNGITGDELITMVSEAENEGGLEPEESELIRSAIEFGDLEVGEIFVPRVDMISAEDTLTVGELKELFDKCDFSRLPVYHENRDHMLGIIHEKDFHKANLSENDSWLGLVKPAMFTTPAELVQQVLSKMQRTKMHMAIVVDEFGGTEGIITMEDILEELVGEIWDEHDEIVETIRQKEDGSYLIDCSASLSDVFELGNIREDCESDTVSGWVTDELGHIPRIGDSFVYENLEVTVTAIHRMRVMEIQVRVIPEEALEKDDKA